MTIHPLSIYGLAQADPRSSRAINDLYFSVFFENIKLRKGCVCIERKTRKRGLKSGVEAQRERFWKEKAFWAHGAHAH